MAELVRLMKRPHAVGPYVAARYVYGEPLDTVRQVALLGSQAAQLAEVPIWQVLLVRTGPPEDDPFYEVVADGTWLVYDPESGNLAAWNDDEFHEVFGPAEPDRLTAVASVIGQTMTLRKGPKEIAAAALAVADSYQEEAASGPRA